MRTTDNASGKSRSPDKKSKSSADTSEPLSHPDLLTVTIDTKTGQIIKIEGTNGTRAQSEDHKLARMLIAGGLLRRRRMRHLLLARLLRERQ